jgi:hypothetical protein
MIGRHYKKNYHCAHFFADWYRENLGIEIPVINEYSLSFVFWLRRHFTQIDQPEENCLVKMTTPTGGAHVGVFSDFAVWHNYKVNNTNGAVCRDPVGIIQRVYSEVTFWRWSE